MTVRLRRYAARFSRSPFGTTTRSIKPNRYWTNKASNAAETASSGDTLTNKRWGVLFDLGTTRC